MLLILIIGGWRDDRGMKQLAPLFGKAVVLTAVMFAFSIIIGSLQFWQRHPDVTEWLIPLILVIGILGGALAGCWSGRRNHANGTE